MKIDSRVFGSRVARRVFLSFILASLLPVVALAFLTSVWVSDALEQRAYEQLSVNARAVGQQILDRLLIARDSLSLTARGELAPTAISAAQVIADDESARPLFGAEFSWADLPMPTGSKPRVATREGAESSDVYILERVGAELLVGQIDPRHLWSIGDLLPFGLDVCVVQTVSRSVLYCNHGISEAARNAMFRELAGRASGQFLWQDDSGDWLAAHWQLFLPSRFETGPWSVIMSQSAALARDPLRGFSRAFLYTIMASLLLTALLSASQIRRVLRPLNRLVSGTKAIAQRRFDTRTNIESDDEFGELGRAMNRMADRLGLQFDKMEAFAEIDRLILSSVSIEQVLQDVLERAKRVLPDGRLSVLIMDPVQLKRGTVYTQTWGLAEDGLARIEVAPALHAWLRTNLDGVDTTIGTFRKCSGAMPLADGYDGVLVAPMMPGGEVRGALVAQFTRPGVRDDALDVVRELAGRLAVAISAADREKELFDRAHFDSLTGLPNRQLCRDRLHQAIAQARRDGHQLAVLFIDLDRFKNVNDSLGHTLGDQLLQEAALRLTSCLRDTDTAARHGGDEYVVILPHVHGALEVEAICAKLVQRLGRPYLIGSHEAFVTASIGAALYPEDGTAGEELLRRADSAMYSAKESGRARCVFFTEELDQHVHERMSMLADLRLALDRNQFRVVYQPQIDLQTGQPVCVEALLRWNHPVRGPVSPSIFLPVLEEVDMVEAVGRWTIERALTDFSAWRELGVVLPRVSVNLAGRQLFERGLADFIDSGLKRLRLDGANLELELTEHNLVTDFVQANIFFKQLRGIGVRVAIDDFGTGYSSLGYLQELHFDCLKVDRVFVNGLPETRSRAIVEAVLTVAHALGKEVVAEGVETKEQQARLAEFGCDIGQGFFFSRPLSADECLEWLKRYDDSTVRIRIQAISA